MSFRHGSIQFLILCELYELMEGQKIKTIKLIHEFIYIQIVN